MDVLSPHVLPECFSGLLLRKVCHTRLLQCSVGHFILKQLLLLYTCYRFVPVCVLLLVERNRDWVLLVILRDGSFDFQAVVGLSSINFSRPIARSHFPMSYILAFIAALPSACQSCLFTELVPV